MRPLSVVIAPDKFKGSLTARQAAEAMRQGVLVAFPDAHVRCVPMADGGEGTIDAITGDHSDQIMRAPVTGPIGQELTATIGLLPRTVGGPVAVVESAQACGLEHVSPTPRTALTATTLGVGQMIRHALHAGATEIVLTVGGTASSDGGAGLLKALGARLTTPTGAAAAPGAAGLLSIAHVDLGPARELLAATTLRVATDVTNPLLGARGAARVFAPQKGADTAAVDTIERALHGWVQALTAAGAPTDLAAHAGSGAGGGVVAAAIALGAQVESGFDLLADLAGFHQSLAGADLILTGEGSLDHQSLAGKVPAGVAAAGRQLDIPVLALAGRIALTPAELTQAGITAADALIDHAHSLADAQHRAFPLLRARTTALVASAVSTAATASVHR